MTVSEKVIVKIHIVLVKVLHKKDDVPQPWKSKTIGGVVLK